MRTTFLQSFVIVLAAACSGAPQASPVQLDAGVDSGGQSGPTQGTSTQASWAFSANTLAELEDLTDFGVVATVESIEDMSPTALGVPNFQTLTIAVDRVLWQADATVVPESLEFQYTVNLDPPTQVTDRWVLYFQEYEPGHYRTVGPSGWFAVTADEHVAPVPGNAIELPANTNIDNFPDL